MVGAETSWVFQGEGLVWGPQGQGWSLHAGILGSPQGGGLGDRMTPGVSGWGYGSDPGREAQEDDPWDGGQGTRIWGDSRERDSGGWDIGVTPGRGLRALTIVVTPGRGAQGTRIWG